MPFLLASLALALLGAVAIVAFESPIRAASGLLTVFVGVAGAAGALAVPIVPGFMLWVGAGGVGVLLLGAALVLSVAAEERGRRRIQLRPTLGLVATAAFWAMLALSVPRTLDAGGAIPARAVAAALATDLAAPLGVALIALATGLVVSLALVRRRT